MGTCSSHKEKLQGQSGWEDYAGGGPAEEEEGNLEIPGTTHLKGILHSNAFDVLAVDKYISIANSVGVDIADQPVVDNHVGKVGSLDMPEGHLTLAESVAVISPTCISQKRNIDMPVGPSMINSLSSPINLGTPNSRIIHRSASIDMDNSTWFQVGKYKRGKHPRTKISNE